MTKDDWKIYSRDGKPYKIMYKDLEFATIHVGDFQRKYGTTEGSKELADALFDLLGLDVEEKPSEPLETNSLEDEKKLALLEERKIALLTEKQSILEELALYKDRLYGFKKTLITDGKYTNPTVYKNVEKKIKELGSKDQKIALELSALNVELRNLRRTVCGRESKQ